MYYLLSFLASAGAIFFIANSGYVSGIALEKGYISALIFAVVLAIVNLILGTILRIVTFPLRLLTLGLFSFVVYFIVVKVTDELVPSVTITGWIPVVAIAFTTTIVGFFMKIFK